MAAMIQNPVVLRQLDPQSVQSPGSQEAYKDNPADLTPFLGTKVRADQPQQGVWTYPQGQVAMASTDYHGNGYYYTNQPRGHAPRPSRPRTSSGTSSSSSARDAIQVLKSSSTPIPTASRSAGYHHQNRSSTLLKQQQQQHYAAGRRERSRQPPADRPSSQSSTASSAPSPAPSLDSGRRSSITSISSTVSQSFSIRSEMSINTKLSLSKRLRKVFSMGNLRSPKDGVDLPQNNSSTASLATVHEGSPTMGPSPLPSRRRSFASLSGLFQKHATINEGTPVTPAPSVSTTSVKEKRLSSGDLKQMAQNKKNNPPRPALRVDTETRGKPTNRGPPSASKSSSRRGSVNVGPESPSSAVSTRSARHQPRFMGNTADGLPSPSPSSSSTSSNRHARSDGVDADMAPPPAIGLHYGLPMHGSPRLRPAVASSSTSSLATSANLSTTDKPRRLQFCPTIQVHETFTAQEYDRTCDPNATCSKLTPMLAMKIKQELNEYKLTDMQVHIDSRQYTHFFL